MSTLVIAFDVYGTLIDPYGMEVHLERVFGNRAKQAAELWRDKQLEYSFRRALMEKYVDFDNCTAQALDYVSQRLGVRLTNEDRQILLNQYLHLPAYSDVAAGLASLRERGHTLFAFSNGTENAVRQLLERASLVHLFREIVSVDDVKSFKPSPAVYQYLAKRTGVPKESIWMVSSNPFDVIGAKSYGLRAVWLQRDPGRIFDPWEFSPDAVVHSLEELSEALAGK